MTIRIAGLCGCLMAAGHVGPDNKCRFKSYRNHRPFVHHCGMTANQTGGEESQEQHR